MASYDATLIAVPEASEQPPAALDVIDPDGAQCLREFKQRMLLSEDEFGQRCESEPPAIPYMDKKLADDIRLYADFVAQLDRANMLRYTLDPKDLVAPFFVRKRSGQLRIVWDCRAVNTRFAKCPKMNMSSGSKLADLEFNTDEDVLSRRPISPITFTIWASPRSCRSSSLCRGSTWPC